jgi:uncharacterized glyoxalase superfamily protein PhnB
MSTDTRVATTNIFPFLRYHDAAAAIDWLVRAFGFEKRMVVAGENGAIAHAELSLGPGLIMLSSTGDDALGMDSPRALGAATQGLYIVVEDVDGHCARARAAGATIVREPRDEDYGGRDYVARDPEGHVWSFGTYVPEA